MVDRGRHGNPMFLEFYNSDYSFCWVGTVGISSLGISREEYESRLTIESLTKSLIKTKYFIRQAVNCRSEISRSKMKFQLLKEGCSMNAILTFLSIS